MRAMVRALYSPPGLGGVDGDVIGGSGAHNIQGVGDGPAALIGADGAAQPLGDLPQLHQSLHRLLQILQVVLVHKVAPFDGLFGRGVALVGVHQDVDIRAQGLPEFFHQQKIPLQIQAALHLDGADTLLAGQDGLFHRRVHVHHHAQAVGHGDRRR